MATGRDWKRLGDFVTRDRTAAGYASRDAFADALEGRVTARTLGNLERGQSVRPSTLVHVEEVLGWEPGSWREVLDGGEPRYRSAAKTSRAGQRSELDDRQKALLLLTPSQIVDNIALFLDGQMSRQAINEWTEEVMELQRKYGGEQKADVPKSERPKPNSA